MLQTIFQKEQLNTLKNISFPRYFHVRGRLGVGQSFLFIGISILPNETCSMEKLLELIFNEISNERG